MATTADLAVRAGEQFTAKPLQRRTALRFLLSGSLTAFAASLLYPLLRYIVPPAEGSVATNDALAGMVGELKPNSAKTFGFGTRPALLVRLASGEYRSMSAGLYAPGLFRAVPARDAADLVPLPQRLL